METVAETHRQALGRFGNPVEEEEKGVEETERSRPPWEGSHNQLTWALGGSQGLNCQPGSLKETELGPLHMCDSSVASSSCWTPNNGNRAISDSYTDFWHPPTPPLLLMVGRFPQP